jgi:hypothetical protein
MAPSRGSASARNNTPYGSWGTWLAGPQAMVNAGPAMDAEAHTGMTLGPRKELRHPNPSKTSQTIAVPRTWSAAAGERSLAPCEPNGYSRAIRPDYKQG